MSEEEKQEQLPAVPTVSEPARAALPSENSPKMPLWRHPMVGILLAALLFFSWLWFDMRERLSQTQQELAKRLLLLDTVSQELRSAFKDTDTRNLVLQTRVTELELKLAASKEQQATLEALVHELTRHREDVLFSEIEQSVMHAAERLSLTRNVEGAVRDLRAIEARLLESPRARFSSLREAISRDLAQLERLPKLDVPAMSRQIEMILLSVESWPLGLRPPELVPEPAEPSQLVDASVWSSAFWSNLGTVLWRDVRSLVRIRRVEQTAVGLFLPENNFFLREIIKLRLLSARLFLLAYDQWAFRRELQEVEGVLVRYFDEENNAVKAAREGITDLLAAEIGRERPHLNETLSVLRTLKLSRED